MAKATPFTRTVTRTRYKEQTILVPTIKRVAIKEEEKLPGYVELNLTPEEAAFLRDAMSRVGGDTKRSARRIADGIRTALTQAGAKSKDFRAGPASLYYHDLTK